MLFKFNIQHSILNTQYSSAQSLITQTSLSGLGGSGGNGGGSGGAGGFGGSGGIFNAGFITGTGSTGFITFIAGTGEGGNGGFLICDVAAITHSSNSAPNTIFDRFINVIFHGMLILEKSIKNVSYILHLIYIRCSK